jgi:uncharacterized protein (TIGR01244 family)
MQEFAQIYNYRYVDEFLSTSGQPSVEQLKSIAEAGFTTVINLALHDDPRYSLPDEAGTITALGLSYIHIPVQFTAPTEQDLLAFFNAMDEHQGEKVWVHCAANMRVSAFLGLYRVIRQGWEVEPAFELMRSLWQPNEVWSLFIASSLKG